MQGVRSKERKKRRGFICSCFDPENKKQREIERPREAARGRAKEREELGNSVDKMAAVATAGDAVHVIHSSAEWQAKLQEALEGKKLIVVDFTATWCGPCKTMSPIFAELSKKYPNVFFLKVDVDQHPDITNQWGVSAMPTFVFILDGKAIDKVVGANKKELEAKVGQYSKA
ncbi:hypothetical protein O6H91_Y521500 [Diphasiastrum complanatum]|nr:hypothetical protein O6H91_Y521500 [Diphasiastrum complanatum]